MELNRKNTGVLLPLSLAFASVAGCSGGEDKTGQQTAHPNIILFMVDDMGWQDTSVPFYKERTRFNDIYETPNMERLASQGVLFSQAYGCSISSPSRCSLLTGVNNARHRVTNWTLEKDKTTDLPSETLILPEWNLNGISMVPGTPRTFVGTSFVQKLKEGGYHTIHCGKAHWGAIDTPGENPTHWGFEVNIAGHAAGGLATYLSENNYGHTPDGKPYSLMAIPGLEKYWGTGTFATEALTQEALRSLDKARKYNQPFFLYMSHYAVHIPIERDPRFFDKYLAKGLSEKEAAYASLVEGMDKSLGDIMDWLEDNGQKDNTIVIFMSDNGALASASYWRDEPLYVQNAPLSSGKGSLYEGGIRVPMIVSWPSVGTPGSRCDKYVMIEDFYPTILEMAGLGASIPKGIDGKSFVGLLEGTKDPSRGRSLIWNYPNVWGNDGPGINLNCAIREGDWKLVYYYEDGRKELFNLADDISETRNLASENPTMTNHLSKALGRALREMDAQRPSYRSTGKPCPWPDGIN